MTILSRSILPPKSISRPEAWVGRDVSLGIFDMLFGLLDSRVILLDSLGRGPRYCT